MALFLLSIYLLLCSILIYRWSYFKDKDINKHFLVSILGIKVLAGLLYAYIYKHYFMTGDTLVFYEESVRIASTFLDYPSYYFKSLLGYEVPIPDADVFIYPSRDIFWKDLGTYVTVHFNALFVPLSFKIYEVQIITSSFISLCAGLNCYKVFKKYFDMPKAVLIGICFLLPSLMFWTSGLHKDVLLFFAISLGILALDRKQIALGILAIVLVGLTRHYYLIFIPLALFTYFFVKARKGKSIALPFVVFFVIGSMAFVAIDIYLLDEKILSIIAKKQTAFNNEVGTAKITTLVNTDTWWSIFSHLPLSLYNAIIRPHFWQSQHIIHFMAGIENIFVLSLFALPLCFKKKEIHLNEWWYALQVFSLGFILLIGIVVVNEGTIVRYRCIAISFLSICACHCTDFARIKALFRINRKEINAELPSPKKQKTESIS